MLAATPVAAPGVPRRQLRSERVRESRRVDLDRADYRHAAFGMGIHRCLDAHLATMELRVAPEEWLARYPDLELANPAAVTWSSGQIRGPQGLSVKVRS
jgi:cytochrome P450